eukprot:2377678-Pyramimonas_sp.AAC.1
MKDLFTDLIYPAMFRRELAFRRRDEIDKRNSTSTGLHIPLLPPRMIMEEDLPLFGIHDCTAKSLLL